MKEIKILIFAFLFLPLFTLAKNKEPKINVYFPESFHANEEIEIFVAVSDLNETFYDIKISIERKKSISETFNAETGLWQDSFYYLKSLFSGPNFEKKFKLRLKKEFAIFEGKADLVVKVRETGKTKFKEYRTKINVLKQETKENSFSDYQKEALTSVSEPFKENFYSTKSIFIATFVSLFSAIIILFLKLKLREIKNADSKN